MKIKIHVSSESTGNIDRLALVPNGTSDSNNSPSKFKTIFDKPLTLDQNKTYVFGLDKIETMTYSWYNISEEYNNDTIRYGVVSGGMITYYNIAFSPGSYSYNNINEYIKDNLLLNSHKEDGIKIEFDLSKFKCELSLKSGFVLDLNNSNFGNLIGFDEKLYGYTKKT